MIFDKILLRWGCVLHDVPHGDAGTHDLAVDIGMDRLLQTVLVTFSRAMRSASRPLTDEIFDT